MAINTTVYDLEEYPEHSKTVTLDLLKVVPVGAQGDEKFLLTCKTNAYSNFTAKDSIDDIFIQEFLCGWCKSSGFKGASFTIVTDISDTLKIKINGASIFYPITLTAGVNMTGDAVAADIQERLRGLTMETADATATDPYILGYKNCRCIFSNSRFIIKSGTISKLLSGPAASSVEVDSANANSALGFDLGVNSKSLSQTSIKEAIVVTEYVADASLLVASPGLGCAAGDSLYITDGGDNHHYFTMMGGIETEIDVMTTASGFSAIPHTYPIGSKIQKLEPNDPEYKPASCLSSVDDALTWSILSLANQIDFSG